MSKPAMDQLRLGLFATSDPRSPRTWSGATPFMLDGLQKVCAEVEPLVPFSASAMRLSFLYARQAKHFIGRYEPAHLNPLVIRAGRARLQSLLSPLNLDAVIGVAASTLVGAVPDGLPTVYLSDATFNLLRDYYEKFSNLPDAIAERAEQHEQEAINRADALIYSSEWAAESAVSHYGAATSKISIIPFGASLPTIPAARTRKPPEGKVRLLFIGVDWVRKGAATAVATAEELRKRGVDATLTIVGCTPPPGVSLPAYVTNIPYLSKSDDHDFRALGRLFADADFFILPTIAECTPIVFSEAAAYSLPVLTTDTGGIASAVTDGETGRLVPINASGKEYADCVEAIISDPALYTIMSQTSRQRFDTVLNWDAWATKVAHAVFGVIR